MAAPSHDCSTTTTSLGGALVALAGLVQLLHLLSTDGSPVLGVLTDVALVVGAGVLAVGLGGGGIVGASRVGRTALVLFGAAPLLDLLPVVPGLWPSVAVGMSIIAIVTVAIVVAAVSVIRAGVLRGLARWALLAVAVDALMTGSLSSLSLGDFPFVYLGWHFELIRPVALLIWGGTIVLHGRMPAIRRRTTALVEDWRSTTDVGVPASDAARDRSARH